MTKKGLIPMTKDGETIDVSPLVVDNHKQLGWSVVGEEPAVSAETTPTAETKSKSTRRKRAGSKVVKTSDEEKEESEK
jgi:hypothetical protein